MPASPASAFHSEEQDHDLIGYRPVSKLAVIALLVGLAAASALAGPLLWCVPVLGVVLAIAALVQLGRAEVPMIGRQAAIAGLALSILFGVIAPVHSATLNYWLVARARRIADDWFADIAKGETQPAYALMIQGSGNKHPPVPTHGESNVAPIKTDLETFAERQPTARLLKLGDKAKPVFLAGEVMPQEGEIRTLGLLYRVPLEPSAADGDIAIDHITVQFNIQRRLEPGRERWLITSVVGSRQ
jgi:hypothetical protein